MPEDPQATPQPAPEGQPVAAVPGGDAGGEPQAAPIAGPPAGGEPRLYAGKYGSVEEMEEAYSEAQSALGRRNEEIGTVRQERDYFAQQLGYDPSAADGGGNVQPAQPPQPPPQQGYPPQAAPQPWQPPQAPQQATPVQRMMEAYLAGDMAGAQRVFEQSTRGTAEHVVGNQHQEITRLQAGIQGLAKTHGLDAVYPVQGKIAGFMAKGLSADDAFYLVNRGATAAQQRSTVEGQATVADGRQAATGPTGAQTPGTPAELDPAAALKKAIMESGPTVQPEYSDL